MGRYGQGSAPQGTQSDPATEWTGEEPETGLEEPMWSMSLSHGGSRGGGTGESYPERPDEAACIYYLRTGFCGYGPRCRFHHPRDRTTGVGALRSGQGEFPERVGQPLCQYYVRTGMCKYGAACKFHHPRQGGGSQVPVNYLGYPLRPGENECMYYMKTGNCKFGATCKFHHPQPDGGGLMVPHTLPALGVVPAPASLSYPTVQSPSSQPYGVVAGDWQVARPPPGPPPMLPGSYIHGYGPPMLFPQGMVPIAGWNPYQGPVNPVGSPSTQHSVGPGPYYGMAAQAYTGGYQLVPSPGGASSSNNQNQQRTPYPERHGQAECHFYMKTGECKYGSSCKYHHPQELVTHKSSSIVLSPMNLPLRPGTPCCAYYAQHGVCKFGPACRFDHPMGLTLSYSPSASSLADIPVAPYPVGSSLSPLAEKQPTTNDSPTSGTNSSDEAPPLK